MGKIILLLLYVDDMLIACEHMSRIHKLKKTMGKEFDMQDLGAAQKIFGMEIRRDKNARRLWLSQGKYIRKILEKFDMYNAKPVSTPLATHFKLRAHDCPSIDKENESMEGIPYASIVGCLMYAMV